MGGKSGEAAFVLSSHIIRLLFIKIVGLMIVNDEGILEIMSK